MAGSVLPAAADPLPLLATAAAQIQQLPREYWVDGVVEAKHQATVSAQTSGVIQKLHFDVDDRVEAGALLLELSSVEQGARAQRSRASVQEAQARAGEAQAAYARVQGIYERKLTSKADLDKALAARNAAQAQLAAAQAQVSESEQERGYTLVRAPYRGVVTARHVQAGEAVQPGKPLMTGVSLDNLRVTADVSQSLAQQLRAQAAARIEVDGMEPVASELITVFPVANPDSHAVRLRIELPKDSGFLPGMHVRVALQSGTQPRLTIPQSALAPRSEIRGVYVVGAQGDVRYRQVRPGERFAGGLVEILAGLQEGEQVALDPAAAVLRLKAMAATGK
jgi:RND family efflux transporter MFP subunit